ncbi:hypothetical protein ABVT39_010112 [Epinephelus coioides]
MTDSNGLARSTAAVPLTVEALDFSYSGVDKMGETERNGAENTHQLLCNVEDESASCHDTIDRPEIKITASDRQDEERQEQHANANSEPPPCHRMDPCFWTEYKTPIDTGGQGRREDF